MRQLSEDQFKNKIFTFSTWTMDNKKILSRAFKLCEDRTIMGYDHPNERYWHFDGQLKILDGNHTVTSAFNYYDQYLDGWTGKNVNEITMKLQDVTEAWTDLPSKDKFEIVVARYNESLSWTDLVKNNVTIYNKGPEAPGFDYTSIQNIGREAGTYLHHIVNNWDNLAEYTLFLQGEPFYHSLFPFKLYMNDKFVSNISNMKKFNDTWLSRSSKVEFWKRYVRIPLPTHYTYSFGAQFCSHRDVIQRRGKQFWQDLYDVSIMPRLDFSIEGIDNYVIGMLFERFWPNIFNPGNLEMLPPEPIKAGRDVPLLTQQNTLRWIQKELCNGVLPYRDPYLEW